MTLQTLSLNGAWQFRQQGAEQFHAAQVPGCVHTDLLHNQLIPDPFWGSNELDLQWIETTDWEYSTTFDVSDELLARAHVELVADGLDTLATIILNGQEIARTENMFVGYRFPVREWLRPGRNQLSIHFANPIDYIQARQKLHSFAEWNDPVGGSSNIRKEPCSFGWDWGPRFATCGIYKNIELQAWDSQPDRAMCACSNSMAMAACCLRSSRSWRSRMPTRACAAGWRWVARLVAQAEGSGAIELAVEQPQLWWPNGLGAQPLYELETELLDADEVLDRQRQRIGLRTIVLDRHADEWGESFQFVVNGVPVFAKGANWIPAHSFVASVSRADYQNLLSSAAEANMNMLRVWGGGIYEMDDFYDLCDQLGLMVWQDFMFACSLYPGDEQFLALVEQEAAYQVPRLANHACMALWCGNNEIEQMPARSPPRPSARPRMRKSFTTSCRLRWRRTIRPRPTGRLRRTTRKATSRATTTSAPAIATSGMSGTRAIR